MDLPSQTLAQQKQHRDTEASSPAHTKNKNFRGCASRQSIPEVAVLWYCFHQHTNADRKLSRMPIDQKMHDNDKKRFWFSNPHACARTAVRTMMLVR